MFNRITTAFQKNSQPDPEIAQKEQIDQNLLQQHWAWLMLPLNDALIISAATLSQFNSDAPQLMALAIRFKPPEEVHQLAAALLRRLVFTEYHGALFNAAPVEQAHIVAHQTAQTWGGMFNKRYGANGVNLNPEAIAQAVYEEMRRLRIFVPPQKAPVQNPPVQAPQPQARIQPTPVREVAHREEPVRSEFKVQESPDIETLMNQTNLAASRPETIASQRSSDQTLENFSESDPEYMHIVGLKLAEKLTKRLTKTSDRIEYLSEKSQGSYIYYGQLIFQLPESIDFDSLTDKVMKSALSGCGFKPGSTPYQLELLENYQVAIDLPIFQNLDSKLKRSNLLLRHLADESNGMSLFNPDRINEFIDLVGDCLRSTIYPGDKHLRYLSGYSSRGEAVTTRIISRSGAGVAIAGKTGCGKSSQILGAIVQCCWALNPSEFQFAAMDFKGQAQTLTLIKDYPHLWKAPTQAGWQKSVGDQGLKFFHEDTDEEISAFDESLWNKDDLDLPSVVWAAKSALALLAALKREKNRRSGIFKHYELQNIFEYDELRLKQPKLDLPEMPLLPIFLEEGGGFARVLGASRACAEVQEITTQWRGWGIPLIKSVQDAQALAALPPGARMNFGSKMVFKSSKECAERLLGRGEWIQIATGLMEQVDAIVETDTGVFHIHPFLVDTNTVKWLLPHLHRKYAKWAKSIPSLPSKQRSLSEGSDDFILPVAREVDDFVSISDDDGSIVDPAKNKERFDLLLKILNQNKRIVKGEGRAGEKPIGIQQTLMQVIGDYEYADKQPHGAKTAIMGKSADRSKRKLIALALLFGKGLTKEDKDLLGLRLADDKPQEVAR